MDDQKTKLTSLESEAQNFNSQLEFERQEKEKLVSALEDLLSEREQELSMVNTQLKGEKKLATELQVCWTRICSIMRLLTAIKSRIEAQNLACSSHQKLDIELQECRTELGQLRFDSACQFDLRNCNDFQLIDNTRSQDIKPFDSSPQKAQVSIIIVLSRQAASDQRTAAIPDG